MGFGHACYKFRVSSEFLWRLHSLHYVCQLRLSKHFFDQSIFEIFTVAKLGLVSLFVEITGSHHSADLLEIFKNRLPRIHFYIDFVVVDSTLLLCFCWCDKQTVLVIFVQSGGWFNTHNWTRAAERHTVTDRFHVWESATTMFDVFRVWRRIVVGYFYRIACVSSVGRPEFQISELPVLRPQHIFVLYWLGECWWTITLSFLGLQQWINPGRMRLLLLQ